MPHKILSVLIRCQAFLFYVYLNIVLMYINFMLYHLLEMLDKSRSKGARAARRVALYICTTSIRI